MYHNRPFPIVILVILSVLQIVVSGFVPRTKSPIIIMSKLHQQHVDNASFFTPTVSLTPDSVQRGINAGLACAKQKGWQVTICICDVGGTPWQVARMPNAFAASYDIACGKAKSAAMFQKPTRALEESVNGGRMALLSVPDDRVLMRGGLQIVVDGKTVGAVGVSGVQANEDEEVAKAAVDSIVNLWETTGGNVRSKL